MPSLDAEQVQLRLTNVPYVLNELRKKRRLVKDENDEEVFMIQFDSRTFEFRKGRVITVGKTIADCLINDALVIVGGALDGPVEPVLEIERSYLLGASDGTVTATTCSYCHVEQETAAKLAKHLLEVHADEDELLETHKPARSAKKAADAPHADAE